MQHIRPATHSDISNVSTMLAHAFVDEEFWYWAMQGDTLSVEQQHQQLKQLFKVQMTRFSLPYNTAYCEDGFKGAALWTPPEQWDLNWWEQLSSLADFIKIVGYRRLLPVLRVIDHIQKVHPRTPHYYLQVVGVHPSYQHQGLSRKILDPILSRCDQEGRAAYLETATSNNVALYRRFGFEILHCLDTLPHGAPKLYCMWREPNQIN